MITVYRSMDTAAKEDCEQIIEILSAEGLSPTLLDDNAPGVPEGVYEVQVPLSEQERAEKLIAANPLKDEREDGDSSNELDLETVYEGAGTTNAEIEAIGIKSLLESQGIDVVMGGDAVLPNLGFAVKVARDQADRARVLIAEAELAGPAAADEAELESESTGPQQ
jgi:hypothetical protein